MWCYWRGHLHETSQAKGFKRFFVGGGAETNGPLPTHQVRFTVEQYVKQPPSHLVSARNQLPSQGRKIGQF
jgi:hypothetical protein